MAITQARTSAAKRIRKVFGNIHEVTQMPNLIQVQRESYEQFLRSNHAIGYVSGMKKRYAASSRSAILPGLPSLISSIMFLKIPNSTLKNAVSAGSPMRRRCA